MIYISKMEPGAGSSTVNVVSGETYTDIGRRLLLGEAIAHGKIVTPGTYIVASPNGAALCASIFEVVEVATPALRIK
jgi:hypothetical protein